MAATVFWVSKVELPEDFGSLEEFLAFWDTHSTADYEDQMEDTDVDIDIRSSKVYWYPLQIKW